MDASRASPDAALPRFASAGDYWELLKPRVMSLVIFTAFVGMAVSAPAEGGASLHPLLAWIALLCIALGAGASGALNMWYDADIDARIPRTRSRPIPQGRILPGEALGFGSALGVGATLSMGALVNWSAAALLAATIGFYLFVYTMWLKRNTPWNIVIGGIAGALPPVIGGVAVSGGISPIAGVLFLVIFLWTPPHSWALALMRGDEYARIGIPMLPSVSGATATCRHILAYSLLLAAAAMLPWLMGEAGVVYLTAAVALNLLFLAAVARLWLAARTRLVAAARTLFRFSILYLFLLLLFLLADSALALP